MSGSLAHWWPLLGLRVRTPRLELRPPTDDDLLALVELARRGVHDPDTMPFMVPWTDLPSPAMERGVLQYHWRCRGEWTPEHWVLNLVCVVDGDVVGMQGVSADDYAVLRTVESGSWIGLAHQGRGIGREMRAAMLHLVFAGLDAAVAHSGAWHDNVASLRVSAANGYVPNGERIRLRRGEPAVEVLLRLDRATWEQRRRADITIEGLTACLPLFGLDQP